MIKENKKIQLPQELYNVICVVGNRLKEFAQRDSVYTVSDFFSLVESLNESSISNELYKVYLGQGLSDENFAQLKEFFESYSASKNFICASSLFLKRSEKWMTHKCLKENILISEPHKISENTYEAYLICDDRCAEMSDHLTGEHLQAMVLIEAARQMMTATAENYWIEFEGRNQKSFVLNNFSSEFLNYAFPLEIKIRLTVQSFRKGFNGNFKTGVLIDMIQMDQVVMRCEGDFSVMDKSSLVQLERTMANNSLQKLFSSIDAEQKVA